MTGILLANHLGKGGVELFFNWLLQNPTLEILGQDFTKGFFIRLFQSLRKIPKPVLGKHQDMVFHFPDVGSLAVIQECPVIFLG